jgi:hypothetical protein
MTLVFLFPFDLSFFDLFSCLHTLSHTIHSLALSDVKLICYMMSRKRISLIKLANFLLKQTVEHVRTVSTQNQISSFSSNSITDYLLEILDDTEGLVKFLADPETDRLLGVHMIGPVHTY